MTDAALVYLLKVILFHGICYAFYWMLLRESKYFSLNRVYLLCALILGFTAPVTMLPATVSTIETVIPDPVNQRAIAEKIVSALIKY